MGEGTVDYCPVHACHASWAEEQATILAHRGQLQPALAQACPADSEALHYLATINEQPAGYLSISLDGSLAEGITRSDHASDTAEALLRQAVLDTPRRGLSRLVAPASHPWRDSLLQLGFAAAENRDNALCLLLPPDRSNNASGSELVRLDQVDQFRAFSVQLVQQAARSLVIFSDDLEAWLYDHDDFTSTVMQLAQKSRNSNIRIIVRDTRALLERGHRLLRACHRASDKIHLHKLPVNQSEKLPCFMIVDDNGLILRPDSQVMQGIGYTDYRARARPLLEQFEQYWTRSYIDPDLRMHTI